MREKTHSTVIILHLSDQGINVNRVVVNVQDSSTENETDFDQTAQSDENSNFSETNAGSENQDDLTGHDSREMESYDFESEEDGDEVSGKPKTQNLVGNVDYKV